MSQMQVHLIRNLRRSVLRGHPWIYREAIAQPGSVAKAQLCQIFDMKKEPLGWGIFDPHSPLCLRLLSLERKSPDARYFENRFVEALKIRRAVINKETTCFR